MGKIYLSELDSCASSTISLNIMYMVVLFPASHPFILRMTFDVVLGGKAEGEPGSYINTVLAILSFMSTENNDSFKTDRIQ